MNIVAITVLLWMGWAAPGLAASFDCAKANTKVEHLICDNPEISKLDEALAQSYKDALQKESKANAIKQAQKKWLKQRNGCGDADCVRRAYEMQLQAITSSDNSVSSVQKKHRFKVTEGKGYSVCENYARFLNSLPESEPLPLCHLKRAPDFPGLKDPDWEELDIPSHLELVYSLEKILSPSRHDRPVDTFDHWKAVYEQQIQKGEASPRLRRTYLALLAEAPLETILAYEPDRSSCDKDMQTKGYAYSGVPPRLYIWNELDKKIELHSSWVAFGVSPELMLYRGRPLLFSTYWGTPRFIGGISVYHFVPAGFYRQYGHVTRCSISFELPSTIIERMTK